MRVNGSKQGVESIDLPMAELVPKLNAERSRFEIDSPEGTAVLTFRRGNTLLDLRHTEVPVALEGGGYGSALALAALNYAREQKLKVVPSCQFVQKWLGRHHEFDDIVVR